MLLTSSGPRRGECGQRQHERYVAVGFSLLVPYIDVSSLKTHYNGMGHVRRGCLSRARQDISTDGSRQEGSHKGWNGIQRAVSSGIELFTALAHDFVLRRNCRIAARGKTPSDFSMASHGTHHIRLANHIAERWNQDLEKDKGSRSVGVGLKKLPTLPQVASDEKFGLVVSEYTNNFKGLLEIKEEAEPLPDFDGPDDDLGRDLFTASDMMKSLNIDPALLDLPQAPVDTEVVAGSSNTVPLRIESGSPPPVSSTSLVVKSELLPGSKRKSTHLGDQQSASEEALGSKRPRIQILQPIGLPGPVSIRVSAHRKLTNLNVFSQGHWPVAAAVCFQLFKGSSQTK